MHPTEPVKARITRIGTITDLPDGTIELDWWGFDITGGALGADYTCDPPRYGGYTLEELRAILAAQPH